MKKISTASLFIFMTTQAFGASSNFQFGSPGTEKLNDVTVSETVKVKINDKDTELKRVAAGLRQKQVAFFTASVYAGQFFTNGTVDKSSVDTLRESLLKNLPVVVSMTFVRDVGIEKIISAYEEVFKENDIKLEGPYAKFIEAVKASGDVKDKQTYWFVFSQNKDKEQFSFQTNGKEMFSVTDGVPGTLKNFLSMWLAKPVAGLEKLQAQLLK